MPPRPSKPLLLFRRVRHPPPNIFSFSTVAPPTPTQPPPNRSHAFSDPQIAVDERRLRWFLAFLRSVSGGSEDKIAGIVRRHKRLLSSDASANVTRNVIRLVKHGVPAAHVSELLFTCPKVMDRFPDKVEHLLELTCSFGVNPKSAAFSDAFIGWGRVSREEFDAKKELLGRMGWSEEKIVEVVSKVPGLMMASSQRIKLVSFLLFGCNATSWSAKSVKQMAHYAKYHLGKSIPRRLRVLQLLMAENVVGKSDVEELLASFFLGNEEFVEEYVKRHVGRVPQLRAVYRDIR